LPQDPSIEHEPSSHGITFGQEPCVPLLTSLVKEARSPHHTPRHPPTTPGAVDAPRRSACGYRRGRVWGACRGVGASWSCPHSVSPLCPKNVSSSILPEARGKSTPVEVSSTGLRISIGLAGRLPQCLRACSPVVTRQGIMPEGTCRVRRRILHPLPYALPRLSPVPHSREKAVRSFLRGVVSRKNLKK
jgi:hypothetical protein